jgi:hypothetical protein
MVERVNDYTITISPVSLGQNRGDRHIRLADPFKLKLNLKTFIYEYREEQTLCWFKKFDINEYYNNSEGHTEPSSTIFGTSPMAHNSILLS